MIQIPIKQYRDFWDYPRIFIVEYKNSAILFECLFDPHKEDYEKEFHVFLMPELSEKGLNGSWENLSEKAERLLGKILADDIIFDESRRKAIDEESLSKLLE